MWKNNTVTNQEYQMGDGIRPLADNIKTQLVYNYEKNTTEMQFAIKNAIRLIENNPNARNVYNALGERKRKTSSRMLRWRIAKYQE